MCCYDLSRFDAGVVIDVMRTHPMAIIGGILRENPFDIPPDQMLRELRGRVHWPPPRTRPGLDMQTPDDLTEENRRPRRTMRDLVALSTLPAVWTGLPPDGIARSLADVPLSTLALDLVYVRLTGLAGDVAIEVVRAPGGIDAVRAAVAPLMAAAPGDAPVTIPDPSGAGTLRAGVTRFGVGGDIGVLVTGSARPDFPTERGRLLLNVGANQTAIVVQRRRAEELPRDADRRRDEFLAPLAPIRTGLQIIKLSDIREDREQARVMMDRQLRQMVRLVDDLLDVSRISRGRLELRRKRVPLSAVLASAVETSRPLIDRMGHALSVALPGRAVAVDADVTRLAQVFSNLSTTPPSPASRAGGSA